MPDPTAIDPLAVPRPAILTIEPEALLEGRRLSSTHPILSLDDSAATSAGQEQRANGPQDLASSGWTCVDGCASRVRQHKAGDDESHPFMLVSG
jgi:hypothetical protein